MPVSGPRRRPYRVADIQSSWLSTLITDPTRALCDFQNLASLMSMPACTCRRRKSDVGHGDVFVPVDGFDLNLARKVGVTCWRFFDAGFTGLMDDLGGRHVADDFLPSSLG